MEVDVSDKSNTTIVNEYDSLSEGNFFPLKSEYESYDKILIFLDQKISQLTQHEIIEKTDFYILVGKSGYLDMRSIKKFYEEENANRKCLAFLLG